MIGTVGVNRFTPLKEEFLRLARGANLIPVCREIVADLDTPISAFQKLAGRGPCYLLESAEGAERVGRYSFIGFSPFLTAVSRDGVTTVRRGQGSDTVEERLPGNPLAVLRGLMSEFRPAEAPGLPRFYGGAVGYCSYDVARYLERLPGTPAADLNLPESAYVITEMVVIFDHLTHRVQVVANALVGDDPAAAYERAVAQVEDVVALLRGRVAPAALYGTQVADGGAGEGGTPSDPDGTRLSLNREAFLAAVETAKEYIRAGDIFQVQVGVRRDRPLRVHPFQVYRSLRAVNPSPYLFYLDFGDLRLVGSSPEMLVRVENGEVEIRPIAGTRRRGHTPEEDTAMERELVNDAKERAEHVMLVDLGRNDIGRVAAPGTVRVTDLMRIERYSAVMHLVSDVCGRLAPGKDAFDALIACFPAGTLTGAPKVRAMEIIDELEPVRRGPYGGCAGYFGFSGNMDAAITIRTIVAYRGRAYIQSAGGIVADSVPELEWKECENKARALLRALDLAEAEAGAAVGTAGVPAAAGEGQA